MDLELAVLALLGVGHPLVVVDEVHARVVVLELFFRLFLRRFRVKEEVSVSVAVVFNL